MNEVKLTIGDYIRIGRANKKLSQRETVNLMENPIAFNHLCKIENGKSSPKINTVIDIARVLDLNFNIQDLVWKEY